ncbi:UNVERIFIED_ORG: putative DNA binding CopG/RHH family protein [Methylorubrum zatmanii]
MERHFNLRMPMALFQELARQAADRGMPIGAYIRSQLASNIGNPTNIHRIKKEPANAS